MTLILAHFIENFIACYNIIMEATPPIAIGLFDMCGSEEQRMKNPKLYHATQRSDFFNYRVSLIWVALSIFHSLVIYFIPTSFYGFGIMWSNGFNADYLTLGNIVYTCVIVTVNLKAGLELHSWNWLHHVSIWGSTIVWVLLFWVYSQIWVLGIPFDASACMTKMFEMVAMSPSFYLSILLVPFTALIVDIAMKYYSTAVRPDETQLARIEDNRNSSGLNAYTQWTQNTTESVNLSQNEQIA